MTDTASPDDAIPSPDDSPEPSLPQDAAGWRALAAGIPPRELLRLVQAEPMRALRLFAGFRPTTDALKTPVVMNRLVEEARRDPAFGRLLADAPASPAGGKPATPPAPRKPAVPPQETQAGQESEERLREKIKEQRTSIRDKERRIGELENELRAAERDRDRAREDAEAAREQRRIAEEQADRVRRRQERDERRPAPSPRQPREKSTAPPTPAIPTWDTPSPWKEAIDRLLSKGRYDAVVEVCREALAAGGDDDPLLHALYARALAGRGHRYHAAAQDQHAAAAFLDRGDIASATEAFARALPHVGSDIDSGLLRRLLTLARKQRRADDVRSVFERLRATDADSYGRLQSAVDALGPEFADFLQRNSTQKIGSDEPISLPEGGIGAISPRRLVQAVEGNDEKIVTGSRRGIRRLQVTNPAVAEALLAAVSVLNPAAVLPLTSSVRPVVVDASNVARYNPDPLSLESPPHVLHLIRMRDFLLRRGFFPIVMVADANLRFHVDDRGEYSRLIDQGLIRETTPGSSADEMLIAEATARSAPLVTNDRLWEWDGAEDIERLGFAIFPNGVSFAF